MKTKYGLPKDVVFCEKCVMSNQRPQSAVEMSSDGKRKKGLKIELGVCVACQFASEKEMIDWQAREEKFLKFLEPYRSNNAQYDCIVPSSGGKDSSFTAHILKNKYGMNPLAVTWAPNIWTDIGQSNFNNLSRVGGIDSLLVTANGPLHRYLTYLAFQNFGHPFQPFVHGQKVIGPKIAEKFGVKLVVYGENQAEYGNEIKDNESPFMSPDFFTSKSPLDIKFGGISVRDILNHNDHFKISDFASYAPLSAQQIQKSKIVMTYLGYFEKWDPQEVYYYAEKNTGFRPAEQRSEGTYSRYTEIDDKIVPIHFYMTYIKFGLGRASYDASQEIRNGHIDREEAIELVRKFDGERPKIWFKDFLDYVKITEERFDQIVDNHRPEHLWARSGNKYKLLNTVYNAEGKNCG